MSKSLIAIPFCSRLHGHQPAERAADAPARQLRERRIQHHRSGNRDSYAQRVHETDARTLQSNLARCVTAAGLVSFVDIIVRNLGAGWTFVLLGLLAAALMGPLLFLAVRVGPKWRRRRADAAAA